MNKDDKGTLVIEFFGATGTPFTQHPLPPLSPEEANFYMVYALDADVRNGGFYGYFGNLPVTEHMVGDLHAALDAVGARQSATLVREASQVLFGSPAIPREQAMSQEFIDEATEAQLDALSPLDTRFYEADELPALLYDYAETHQAGIRGAPAFFAGARPSPESRPSLMSRFRKLFGG